MTTTTSLTAKYTSHRAGKHNLVKNSLALLMLAIPMAFVQPRLTIYGPQELKDKFEYSGKYT
jgi:hypothetical protein